jgi:ribosomal subunit interface protein
MNINIKATSIVLSDAIRGYAEKRIESLRKVLGEDTDGVVVDVELSQTTKHHKSGAIFRTEITVRNAGRRFRAVSVKDDLYASIDDAKEEMEHEIINKKERSQTLFRRGAQQIKYVLKGIGNLPRRFRRK